MSHLHMLELAQKKEIYRSNIHMFINGKHRFNSNDFFLVAYGSVRNVFVNPFMVGRPADYAPEGPPTNKKLFGGGLVFSGSRIVHVCRFLSA